MGVGVSVGVGFDVGVGGGVGGLAGEAQAPNRITPASNATNITFIAASPLSKN